MASHTGILDLPLELLLLIVQNLDVPSFLRLASTCKALHGSEILYDSSYWSALVKTTFRVPNQPVLEDDGKRWYKLYKRMRTQSRVYVWGNDDRACLNVAPQTQTWEIGGFRAVVSGRIRLSAPAYMEGVADLGVISDLQCGGWSTVLLTASGALYMSGVIDGDVRQQAAVRKPRPLLYPPGYVSPHERYDASTAIRQLSVGRAHVLALSDTGRIWSWTDADRAGLHVKFLSHDLVENGKSRGDGVVRKVVAGWNKSAALIDGTGIVLWDPLRRDNDETSFADAALVIQSRIVPHTSFLAHTRLTVLERADGKANIASDIGEVANFIVLEKVVLFNTCLGTVYVSEQNDDGNYTEPTQVPLTAEDGNEAFYATDVQGSFQSFAIFGKSGAVLTGKRDELLDLVHGRPEGQPSLSRIPALQSSNVIQVAFGDWHFHALHASGHITSYGNEPSSCGALGLGRAEGSGSLRGLRFNGRRDTHLLPQADAILGRRIWFEKEKYAWLDHLRSGGVDPQEAVERVNMAIGTPGSTARCEVEVSEWIEQESRAWLDKLYLRDADEDGLGAYFALNVTAAGWHSGALVLVNDELQKRMTATCFPPPEPGPSLLDSAVSLATRFGRQFLGLPPVTAPNQPTADTAQRGELQRPAQNASNGAPTRPAPSDVWAHEHFPRLVLSDGTEMPGTVPFDEWTYGRPTWDR